MSQRSDDALTPRALTLCVDDLVMRPVQRAALQALVECYLAGRADGTMDAFAFPGDPDDQLDLDADEGAPLIPEQMAAALTAFHELYCPGVERLVPIPTDLPSVHDLRRATAWKATVDRVRGLGTGEHVLQWLKLQFRRLELHLCEGCVAGAPTQTPGTNLGSFRALPEDSRTSETGEVAPDGPFGGDGFRYKGATVHFGRAALRWTLMQSLWDVQQSRPRPPRPAEDVIADVYGSDNDTEDSTFRQLIADTRRQLEAANLLLAIKYLGGKVWLEPLTL
jgi:hypothetical protein